MKLLGIDYGGSKVGLAVGDSENQLAWPYKIINYCSWKSLIKEIREICRQEEVGKIVVGLPLGLASQPSPQSEIVNKFINRLRKNFKIPVIDWDERFTTCQAKKMIGRGREDAAAAMLILQAYLDYQSNSSRPADQEK